MGPCDVSNNESTKPSIADEYVGAEAEDKVGYAGFAGDEHGIRKRVSRCRLEEDIGGTTNLERGIRSKQLVAANMCCLQPADELLE